MFLRSLTMRGFKSFADRTTLEFTPGISVIVGPNGSGKSNVADAVAWVLGEQGPRALRGGQMADVIFAGSPGRPALGMAEVGLVIDNSAGLIPVPASEVEISRTIYRSGESEYRLGGRPCRLLDIQELLSDTGVGRGLHTLIGQGHLEDVLTARPDERRQLVEEAAGVAKHRRRRERAERKLDGLEQDLLRLQDVLAELRRQLKPLRQQAELAARHDALTREAAELAARLAAVRLRDLYGERERRRPAWEEMERRQGEARERLGQLDAEIARLERERARAEEEQRRAEQRHAAAARARSESEAAFRESLRREAEARDRMASAATRSARLFAVEDELARTERALEEVRAGFDGRQAEVEEAERAFRAALQARRDAEEERRRLESEAAARRAEAETIGRTLAGHEDERRRLRAQASELRDRVRTASERAEALEAEVERLDALASPLAAEQRSLGAEQAELSRAIGQLEAAEKGLLARQEVVDARILELSESPGAAFARRRGERPLGVLRDLVSAPPPVRPALRAALGPLGDAVVYPDHAAAVEEAAAATPGLTLLDGSAGAVEDGGSEPIAGAERVLALVTPDPRVAGLARSLLEGTYLVGTLAEAVARRRVHPEAVFVTRDGVVVGPTFVRTVPGTDVRIEALRRDSAALERELAAIRRDVRERRRRLHAAEARAEQVRGDLESADRAITVAAEEMAGLRAEIASLTREESMLAQRLAALDAAVDEARRRVRPSGEGPGPLPPLPPVPEPPLHLRVEVEALRRERARLEAGVARARRELDELAADDPVALRRSLQDAEASRAAAEAALHDREREEESALGEYRARSEGARAAREREAETNRAWREQAAVAERVRADHEDEERARVEVERRVAEAERVLVEGHGADAAAAVASLSEDETAEDVQRRAELVARRLGLLGRVNLLAPGELESVQERHDFMARELEDVRRARSDLREVIAEVDRTMAELFDASFRDVAREFASLFEVLFPGGEGRLTLTDPDRPLESGIEVEARPGGKRVKRLSLLSGGERSLAALAFLFAVFRARPSPFYLMDEVEAALDDVNLNRFLDVLRGFAETSQVLIVTHQKRTMETADVLYGVSMGKDGASRVISQRLADVGAR